MDSKKIEKNFVTLISVLSSLQTGANLERHLLLY